MMHVHYDFSLVLGSIVVALLACFFAVSTERLLFRAWRKKFQTGLILLSSFFLGCAIWAMHFVGMLACDLPTHSYFDPALTILSFFGGVSKSMLKKSRLNFDKIEKCK